MAKRKKSTAEIADALGVSHDSSGFAAVADMPVDQTTMQETAPPEGAESIGGITHPATPSATGFAGVDEMLELEKLLSVESKDNQLATYDKLSPKAKKLFLSTYQPDPIMNIMQNDPMFVDKKAVPEQVHLHWLSAEVIAELGWRGYQRVPNTAKYRKWAPNLRLHPSQQWLQSGKNILGYKPHLEWLKDILDELKPVNEITEEADKRFSSALRSVHSDLGLTRAEAEALDAELGGLVGYRGSDPSLTPDEDLRDED